MSEPTEADSSYSASQDLFDNPDEPMDIDNISPDKIVDLNDIEAETSHIETSPSILSFDKPTLEVTSSPVRSETSTPTHPTADMRAFWKGCPLKDMYTNLSLKPIRPSASVDRYVVCVEFGKYKDGSVPLAHPPSIRAGLDKWDSNHVRMPFSEENMYPVTADNGKREIQKRFYNFSILL